MEASFAVGIVGLVALLALIAVRVPIAYTMILVGVVGTSLQSGPAIVANQLKDLAYAQFSVYDLSVLPMFILMGGLAARCGPEPRPVPRRPCLAGTHARRHRHGGDRGLRRLRRGVRLVHSHTASTMGQVALPELRRYAYSPALATGDDRGGRHARHPDPRLRWCSSSTRSSWRRTSSPCSPRRCCRDCWRCSCS